MPSPTFPHNRFLEHRARLDVWHPAIKAVLKGYARPLLAGSVSVEVAGVEHLVEVVTDQPMVGVARAWWLCSGCGRRCRHLYASTGGEQLRCRLCLRLEPRSRHLGRLASAGGDNPAAAAARLRRWLGADERLFSPIAPRRWTARQLRLVMAIADEERKLIAGVARSNARVRDGH